MECINHCRHACLNTCHQVYESVESVYGSGTRCFNNCNFKCTGRCMLGPPATPTPTPSPEQPRTMQLTFNMDISTMSVAELDAFKTGFSTNLAASMGVNANLVQVTS